MKRETPIVRAVIEALNASLLAFVWRNQSGIVKVKRGWLHLAPAGSPDVCGWASDGRFVGLEIKTEDGRTGKERAARQAEWRERIRAAGGIAAEVRSAGEAVAIVRDALARRAA